jgi:hypothetical protein
MAMIRQGRETVIINFEMASMTAVVRKRNLTARYPIALRKNNLVIALNRIAVEISMTINTD